MLSSAHNGNPAHLGAVVYAPSFFRSDDALLAALRQGHRGARAVFYQRHVRDVEALLVRVLGAHDNIPEATQTVFLSALRRLPKFSGSADALRLWLMRLTIREAERALKRRRLRSLFTIHSLSAVHSITSAARSTRSKTFFGSGSSHAPLNLAVADVKSFGRGDVPTSPPPNSASSVSGHLSIAAAGSGEMVAMRSGVANSGLHPVPPSSESIRGAVPQRRVYALLDHLPVRFRVAFCLHYVAQLDIGEVAELCCLSLSAARRAVLRGKDRFTQLALTDDIVTTWLV